LVYIIENHSVVLNIGGAGIENIDFENPPKNGGQLG